MYGSGSRARSRNTTSGNASADSGSLSAGTDHCLTDLTRPVCSRLASNCPELAVSPLAMATVSFNRSFCLPLWFVQPSVVTKLLLSSQLTDVPRLRKACPARVLPSEPRRPSAPGTDPDISDSESAGPKQSDERYAVSPRLRVHSCSDSSSCS